ncbi:MAG: hypothetical protein HKN45_09755 [Flavobacteriales bacterium]|nr:hypothetical protein [Flavobacteriales bacterium]
MKKVVFLIAIVAYASICIAQESTDKDMVRSACLNYLEGFYQGDAEKIKACMKPSLHKLGYWKDSELGTYSEPIHMSHQGAIDYANDVKDNQKFPDDAAPMEVDVLDVMNHIAAAKVTAWWGYDYILLSKEGDKWMIEQVLWEGPLNNR